MADACFYYIYFAVAVIVIIGIGVAGILLIRSGRRLSREELSRTEEADALAKADPDRRPSDGV